MDTPTVAAISAEYRYLWVDPIWSRNYGVPQEGVVGLSLEEVWGTQLFRQRYKPLIDRAFNREKVRRVLEVPSGERDIRMVEVHLTLIEVGVISPFVIALTREITNSYPLRFSDESAQDKLDAMFQGDETHSLVVSAEGRVLDLSQGLVEYFGDCRSDLNGESLFTILEERGREEAAEQFYTAMRLARSGQTHEFDTRLRKKEGGPVLFHFWVRARFADGILECYEFSCYEVTERNLSFRYLRESEEHLATLFDTISIAMLICIGQTVERANPAALELLAADNEVRLRGLTLGDLFPLPPSETPAETTVRRLDGTIVKVDLTVTHLMLAGRRHQLYLCYNLSHQERLRDVLESATHDAEQASRAKTAFLTTMSHEIRTPLNGILGLLHLAKRTPNPDKQSLYLDKLERATQGLLSIVNDVLDFSALEDSEVTLAVRDFELSEVLDELRAGLDDWTRDRPELGVALELDPEVPSRLRGDPEKLLKILSTLCHNAVKFTPHGRILVRGSLSFRDETHVSLRFSVSDTGIGIADDQLQTIFSPFTQADSSSTRFYGGVGLGLFLCKRYVDLLGGTIDVNSKPGEGTRFSFTVRFAPSSTSVRAPRLPGCALLMVDGTRSSLDGAVGIFERLGCDYCLCNTGDEAVLASKDFYQIVILDSKLPQLVELLQLFRTLVPKDDQLIFLLSRFHDREEFQRSVDLGFDGLLSKPLRESAFLEAVAVAKRRQRRSRTGMDRDGARFLSGRVLVVDDNDINQEVAAEIVRQLGPEVDVAANGWQALERANVCDYGVILMDLQMPGMDGLEATKRLRSRGCRSPIVALTANTRPQDQEACRAAGMDGFLSKPVDPDVLFEALEPFLAPAQALSGAQEAPTGTDQEQLELITGVNLQQGLVRLGGNKRLFRKLLIQFGKRHAELADSMRRAYRSGNLKELRELSHTLKGTAGNLGVEVLANLSQQVELSARDGSLPSDSVMVALEEELGRVIPSVLALEQESGLNNNEENAWLDTARAKNLLVELDNQLDLDLTRAFEILEQVDDVFKGTVLVEVASQLRILMDEFEIERARPMILQILESLEKR